jgi:hypothetical protein
VRSLQSSDLGKRDDGIHRGEEPLELQYGRNGYYGGLQMSSGFESAAGGEYTATLGTADRWPV